MKQSPRLEAVRTEGKKLRRYALPLPRCLATLRSQRTDNVQVSPLDVTDLPTEGAIEIPPEPQTNRINSPDEREEEEDLEALASKLERTALDENAIEDSAITPASDGEPSSGLQPAPPPIYDNPSSSDDGEGEWITPSNVGLHKSRALDLLPQDAKKTGKLANEKVQVGCMTADFAMQNVLLHMGLSLVGVEGKRITSVKSWVLRCHACFK